MKKICILTATRAEYGLLKPIIEKFIYQKKVEVKVVVTGMHLSPEFGLTYKEIEEDGIKIDKKINILMSSDSSDGISKTMGMALITFSDYFEEERPDALIVLGDRYETLAVAICAMNANIPIIHLYGGDITEGAIDDAIRHSITKLSCLHFTATEEHRLRVIQLGENPDRVYWVGAMSAENTRKITLMNREELTKSLGIDWGEKKLVVATYHPETLGDIDIKKYIVSFLKALDSFENIYTIFTASNADKGGRTINEMLIEYVNNHKDKCIMVQSLGLKRYLSAISLADVVIGNSSSGISEVPSFGVPTVNIGDRQKGRTMGNSVICCKSDTESVQRAIENVLNNDFKNSLKELINPYEKEGTSDNIVSIITKYVLEDKLDIHKEFWKIL